MWRTKSIRTQCLQSELKSAPIEGSIRPSQQTFYLPTCQDRKEIAKCRKTKQVVIEKRKVKQQVTVRLQEVQVALFKFAWVALSYSLTLATQSKVSKLLASKEKLRSYKINERKLLTNPNFFPQIFCFLTLFRSHNNTIICGAICVNCQSFYPLADVSQQISF